MIGKTPPSMGGFPATGQDVQRHTQLVCYYKLIRNSGLEFWLVGEKMAQATSAFRDPLPAWTGFHGSRAVSAFPIPAPHSSSNLFHTGASSSFPSSVPVVTFSPRRWQWKMCSPSLFLTAQWKYGPFLISLVWAFSMVLVTSILTCLCNPSQGFIPSSSLKHIPRLSLTYSDTE